MTQILPTSSAINCTKLLNDEPLCRSVIAHAYGRNLQFADVRAQIELRINSSFECHGEPHVLRDCAVTELVDMAPGEIRIARDLLGHSQLRTTEKR